MSEPTFSIKKNDLLPSLEATVQYSDGTAVDLTTATGVFIMADEQGTVKVNRTACVIVTPSAGEVRYDWTGTDTDTAGVYHAEFEFSFAGKPLTAPNSTYIRVTVFEDLG